MKMGKKARRTVKAQILGQPLLMIFAAIVGIMIILFGIKLVANLKTTGEDIEISRFIAELDKIVNRYNYLDVDSSTVVKVDIPERVKEVCFSNPGPVTFELKDYYNRGYPGLVQVVEANSDSNLFLIPLNAFNRNNFVVKNLKLKPEWRNPLCVPNKRGMFLRTDAEGYVTAFNELTDEDCESIKTEFFSEISNPNFCRLFTGNNIPEVGLCALCREG